VINISSGGYYGETAASGYHDSLAYAEANDVLVVASAGKGDGIGQLSGLASRPGVVAVSAVDDTGTFRPDVSNQGPDVELAAPGVAMPMLSEDGDAGFRLKTFTGTSLSAPIVAGTAALIRSEYPDLNAASVVQRLISTATDAGPPGHDPQYGHGIVNPVAALTAEVAPTAENPLGSVTDLLETTPPVPVAQGPPESSAGEPISLGVVFGVLGGAVVLGGAAVLVVVLLVRRRRPAPVRHPAPPGPWR
jgi:subtilisin family serine protease